MSGMGGKNGAEGGIRVVETLRGREVLVTGAAGFLGKVWLAMVLDRAPEIGKIFVLLRARKGETAAARLDRMLARSPAFRTLRERIGYPALRRLAREKLEAIDGDVAKANCGIDDATLARITRSIEVVVHFAGLTDFMPDPASALATNVRGAMHAADLAARTRSGRILHVSTAYVAGRVSGEIPEALTPGVSPNGTVFDPHRELEELASMCASVRGRRGRMDAGKARGEALGWANIYTYSKGLAEHLLLGRSDVRTTIVRPTIVECAREYPFPGWNEGINTSGPLVWLFSTSFRRFPSRASHRFDVVPVDTVARATLLVLAAMLRDQAGDVYQVGSSDCNPLTFDRAIELTNLGVRRMHGRDDARALDRYLTRFLDCVPVDADFDLPFGRETMQQAMRKASDLLGRFRAERELPPTLYARIGKRVEEGVAKTLSSLRAADRNVKRVEQLLELYRPFVHDHDYVFATDRTRALSDALVPEERAFFAFDIDAVEWRSYWLDVQVPGLEKWSLPLMRGEEVEDDPEPVDFDDALASPPPDPDEARRGQRTASAEGALS